MNAAVVYFSRTGNTKKVAEAMADEMGCKAVPIGEYDLQKPADLLLIGGAVYGGKLEPSLAEFLGRLEPSGIRRAVLFSTYFMGETATGMMADVLKARGVTVDERRFSCKGKFLFMHRRFPGEAELDQARKFAVSVAGKNQ